MKNGWQIKKLDDIVVSTTIGLVRNKNQQGNGYPYLYVKMNNISNDNSFDPSGMVRVEASAAELNRFELVDGDLLFNTRNSHELVGKSCVYRSIGKTPVLFNNNVMRIRFNTGLTPEFAGYAFSSQIVREQLEAMVSGTTNVAGIYYKHLKSLKIPVPPLPEQQRIVAILDEAFTSIATARRCAQQNLQNARALFESHLNAVFSQRGEGWVEKPLGEVCIFNSGGTPSKKNINYWKGDIPWVSGRDMKSTRLSDAALHISRKAVEESSTRMAPAGALLTLVRGMGLAHGAQIAELMGPCAFNQDIRAILPNNDIVPRYLLFALRTRINSSENVLSSAAHGTLKIDMDGLKKVSVPIPALTQQQQIVYGIDRLSEETQRLASIYQRKLAALDELKKSLLDQAFRGELTADGKNAGRKLAEAGG